VYVNFGSITVQTPQKMLQFAWGLANSKQPFLWILRPSNGGCESTILPPEFLAETKDRGNLASWCLQEQILKHPSTGGFASHMGWNSMLESVSCGVPFLCWPFFVEQQTNCCFASNNWGIDVKREIKLRSLLESYGGRKG
jgi:hypothetical protein